jgi:leucyl-tRNA synthetase
MEEMCLNPKEHQKTPKKIKKIPKTRVQVTEETEEMRFNTGIAAMMEFVNCAYKWDERPRAVLEPFVVMAWLPVRPSVCLSACPCCL